ETPYAQQAVQRAGRFIAVHQAEFGEADRQVAIAFQAMFEDLHVAGAVHRLDGEPALVLRLAARRLRGEHVLPVPAPVARSLPQGLIEHLRGVHFVVVASEASAHIGDDRLEQRPALRVPEHDARAFLLEMKQVELAPELAMVALLGLLYLL